MSISKPYTEKAIRAEIKRFIRLYPREQVGEAIVRYIGDNFVPKLSPKKELMLMVDKDLVIGLVCQYFDLSLETMANKTRKPAIVYPRQVMEFMLSTKTPLSLADVGRLLGRHHTTVLASKNKIIEAYQKNPTVRRDIDELINRLPQEAQNEEETPEDDNQTTTP